MATEDLIKQAVEDYSTSYHLCGVDPATCDPAAFTASQGPSRSILVDLVSSMSQQGIHFAPDDGGSYVVAEKLSVISATEATAVYCVFDAGTVLGPAGPDGAPTLINNQQLSFRNEYHLYLNDGSWLVGQKNELERLGEGNLCPPAV